MNEASLIIDNSNDKLFLKFSGEFTLYLISGFKKRIDGTNLSNVKSVDLDLSELILLDTASAIFINSLQKQFSKKTYQSF